MISAISKGKTSLWRIKTYLEAPEKRTPGYVVGATPEDVSITLSNISSGWNDNAVSTKQEDVVLEGININIAGPGLYGVIGKVGSGKSTLLSTILHDATLYRGDLQVNGTVAYAPQQAWIMNATIRDNILFGEPYDDNRYNAIIDACGLRIDIEALPAGNDTEIGEKGVNWGGQKQRLALAVCMSSAQIMTPMMLSALWTCCGETSLRKFDFGYSERKTFCVTHYLHLMKDCKEMFVVHEGRITDQEHMRN